MRQLFQPRLIEDVFLVQEYAFDASIIAEHAKKELENLGVEVRCNTTVTEVRSIPKVGCGCCRIPPPAKSAGL